MSENKTKVLVVDDDARLRDLLNRYLGEQGYSVRTVSNATEMNRQLARERYDLMILDLMLPGRRRAFDLPPSARRQRGHADHHAHG
jgi:DNA-binding response OmpR family regulator